MAALSKFNLVSVMERTAQEETRAIVREYFAPLIELNRGPIIQVHAAVTKNGLTRAVRKTKVSQLADMEVDSPTFFKAPKRVSVKAWEDRWSSTRTYVQRKTGFVWRINRDHEQGGVWITRTR
jgi:hypothetical protein